jgi:protease-4
LEALPGMLLRATGQRGGFQLGVGLRRTRSGYAMRRAHDDGGGFVAHTHAVSIHGGEERTVLTGGPERRVAVLRAAGALGDEALGGVSLLGGDARTPSAPLHRALERALEDPLTRGVLLDLRGVTGLAQIDELRARVAALRAAGKPVVAWMEYGGGRGDLLLAAACDRVVAAPEAGFYALGLRAERRYYRGLLERWGVRIDRSSIGAYKSAYRGFSVDSTPPADREVLEHNLDLLQERFVATVSTDRRMSRERLLTLLDGRYWEPADLAGAGLIDSVGYREDALAALGGLAGLGAKPRTVDARRIAPVTREWTVRARIAVVYAAGGIEVGRSGNDLLMGPTLGSETLVRQIERAFKDRRVQAVVLRVESPGGSALASDLIHHALGRMKRETRKPLVVSMGGVAASGGYHIAAPGDHIVAGRFTATGSIGVVFVRPSLEGWYAKHGVRQDAFERGQHMRAWSLGRDWDAAIQAGADSSIARGYRRFVARMARDRGLPEAAVDSVAQGRVWYGEDALRHRLVDGLGGLEQALAEARRRAGVPAGERIRPLEFRRPAPGFVQRVVGDVVRATLEREARLSEPSGVREWADLDGVW